MPHILIFGAGLVVGAAIAWLLDQDSIKQVIDLVNKERRETRR